MVDLSIAMLNYQRVNYCISYILSPSKCMQMPSPNRALPNTLPQHRMDLLHSLGWAVDAPDKYFTYSQ